MRARSSSMVDQVVVVPGDVCQGVCPATAGMNGVVSGAKGDAEGPGQLGGVIDNQQLLHRTHLPR